MTVLPMAHEYVEPTDGRSCVTCGNVKSFGIHRVQNVPSHAMKARGRSVYRTSSVPYEARTGLWAALSMTTTQEDQR